MYFYQSFLWIIPFIFSHNDCESDSDCGLNGFYRYENRAQVVAASLESATRDKERLVSQLESTKVL